MPNHIQNRLKIIGSNEQIKEVRSFLQSNEPIEEGENKGKYAPIDFNKILPMPKSLEVEASSNYAYPLLFGGGDCAFLGVAELQRRFADMDAERQKEHFERALIYHDNKTKYGHETWYGWAIDNWGTKWGAYEVFDKRSTFETLWFQTAWSNVRGMILKLSIQFPTVVFDYTYADEDTGCNVGQMKIQNGEITALNQPQNCSNEAYEIAFEMHPDRKSWFKLINGKYEYVDDEEEIKFSNTDTQGVLEESADSEKATDSSLGGTSLE